MTDEEKLLGDQIMDTSEVNHERLLPFMISADTLVRFENRDIDHWKEFWNNAHNVEQYLKNKEKSLEDE